MENMTDLEMKESTMAILRLIFKENVTEPIAFAATRWASDPFAAGSYTATPPKVKLNDLKTLATPIGNTLFFAGEHTVPAAAATAHGALVSGIHAALNIMDLPSNLKDSYVNPNPLIDITDFNDWFTDSGVTSIHGKLAHYLKCKIM